MNHDLTPKQTTAATAIGFIAILLWATLALFTSLTNDKDGVNIPSFQLLFLSFVIGASVNATWLAASGQLNKAAFAAPKNAWLLSVGGMFFITFSTLTPCHAHQRWKLA